ncbi:MAG: FRG domain-containing protein [Thermodesulfobacteriota bacterium]
MDTYNVSHLTDFYKAIENISKRFGGIHLWYRGHSAEIWDLVPSLYHRSKAPDENALAVLFRSKAKVRYERCPANNNYPAWLFLMQHYRLPTRLMDWTESPLVALFFAVENCALDYRDGCLWVLHPMLLNKYSYGEAVIPAADNSKIAPLFREAFIAPDEPNPKIFAVLPFHTDLRHLLQQSAVTVHGIGTPINQLEHCDDFIAKIIIPKSAKHSFRKALNLLHISQSTLFPDLENLSVDLVQTNFLDQR